MVIRKKAAPVARSLPLIPSLPLVLPWPCLCADNHRLMWVYGQARLSSEYRRAKQQVQERAQLWWRHPAIEQDVALIARFWFPDKRRRDAGNYRKLLTDALTGVVYVDDAQVADERCVRVGFDKTNPRAEISITLFQGEMAA